MQDSPNEVAIAHDEPENVREGKRWGRIVAPYGTASGSRAAAELLGTVFAFAATWAAMYASWHSPYAWLCIPLAIPASLLLVRMFVIQHDCGHGSFLPTRRANDRLGRALSVLTLAPYDYWRRSHAIHHATSGNLGKRGIGDIDVLTVAEYLACSKRQRFVYRLNRNPFILFGIGPSFLFLLKHRLPVGWMHEGRDAWQPVMLTNLAIVIFTLFMGSALGFAAYLSIQLPVTILAATIGVWLFYVQHQFPDTYWAPNEEWSFHAGAIQGSTFYDLPKWLHWATGHIGIHHIHHLSSRIPSYRLARVLKDHPALRDVGRLSVRGSLRCLRLALWDEATSQLVPFDPVDRSQQAR